MQLIMKQIFQAIIIFLLLLFVISLTSPLPSHKSGDSPEAELAETIMEEDDFSSLMGLEECADKDEGSACHVRRMIAEAHLDYIYTQHHKP